MPEPKLLAKIVGSFCLVLGLVSCASVSIENGTEHVTEKSPEVVYVMPFDTSHAEFNVDREGKELVEFKQDMVLMLKAGIGKDLSDRLIAAKPGTKSDWMRSQNAWIVQGQFVRVNQGSRLLRSTIGFGAGGTKVETRVQVYSLAQHTGTPFLTFATTGGSGAEPGAVLAVTADPLQLAIGAVSGIAHGLTEDTERTARMVTAKLSDYMYHRGWIPEDKWIKPKTLDGGDMW